MKNQKGQALVEWVQKIQENLSLLKPSLEPFVLAILGKEINNFSLFVFRRRVALATTLAQISFGTPRFSLKPFASFDHLLK